MNRPLGSVALPAARSESCALEPTLCAQGSSDFERNSSDRPGDPGWTAAARKESWMTRPFRLKFANFTCAPKNTKGLASPLKIHGASSVHSRKFPVLLWRVSRGVKHNQVFQSIKVSHTSPTRRATTRAHACVRTPASRRVFPILLISRQSFTHGCPRVDPGYGDSEPCL